MENGCYARPSGVGGCGRSGRDEESARRLGHQRQPHRRSLAYVTTSLFVFLGAIVLLAQLGIGDPAQGVGYTLSSITAVVLGGTSLLGGRGTFIGTLFGAVLIVQVLNATVFLGLNQTWQYFFQGALIMVAAVIYSQVRGARAGVTLSPSPDHHRHEAGARCVQHASTASPTSASRTSTVPQLTGPDDVLRRGALVRHLRHGPARVPGRADRHADRAAPAHRGRRCRRRSATSSPRRVVEVGSRGQRRRRR